MTKIIPSPAALAILKSLARQSSPRLALCPVWIRLRTASSYTHPNDAKAISVLPTNIDTSSEVYKENLKQTKSLLSSLAEKHSKILEGGPPKAREKHVGRGKMLPRE